MLLAAGMFQQKQENCGMGLCVTDTGTVAQSSPSKHEL